MNAERLAKLIYDYMHSDKEWLRMMNPRLWEDRSQKTKNRYIKLAEFIIQQLK